MHGIVLEQTFTQGCSTSQRRTLHVSTFPQ